MSRKEQIDDKKWEVRRPELSDLMPLGLEYRKEAP